MKRRCPAHGMVEAVIDGTCAVCGAPALDEANPAHREALAEIFRDRRKKLVETTLAVAGILGLVAMPIAIILIWKTQDPDIYMGITMTAIVVAIVVGLAVRRPAFLTGTTFVFIVLCGAFIPITFHVGYPALWFQGLGDGGAYRVLTSTLTHGGFMHFAGNMLGLLAFAPMVESRVGRLGTAVILFVGTFTGMVGHSLTSVEPAVGASAAVFGAFGATLSLFPTEQRVLRINEVAIPMPVWVFMLVVIVAFTLIDAANETSNVAWAAHLGGFIGGALIAIPLRWIPESEAYRKARDAQRENMRELMALAMVQLDHFTEKTRAASDDAAADPSPANSMDRQIAEFHRAGQRRALVAQLVGGGLFLVIGTLAAVLGAYLDAGPFAASRRVQVILVGVIMAAAGLAMLTKIRWAGSPGRPRSHPDPEARSPAAARSD